MALRSLTPRAARALRGAATILVVPSVAACGADDGTTSRAPLTTDASASSSAPSSSEPSSEPTSEPSSEPTGPPPVFSNEGLPALGAPVPLGDWTFTVTAVDDDAWDVLEPMSSLNQPPASGTYLLVDYTATYAGAAPADTAVALVPYAVGTDGSIAQGLECGAMSDRALSTVDPDLLVQPGETISWQECMDLSGELADGGAVGMRIGDHPEWGTAGWALP